MFDWVTESGMKTLIRAAGQHRAIGQRPPGKHTRRAAFNSAPSAHVVFVKQFGGSGAPSRPPTQLQVARLLLLTQRSFLSRTLRCLPDRWEQFGWIQ